jgi:hypothetical protein
MARGRIPLVIAGFALIATACSSRPFHFLGDAELPTRDQCLANLRTDSNPITVPRGQVLLLDYDIVPCDSPAAEFRVANNALGTPEDQPVPACPPDQDRVVMRSVPEGDGLMANWPICLVRLR